MKGNRLTSEFKLSILIPTVEGREEFLRTLLRTLDPQITDEVEIIIHKTPHGTPTTGEKRNWLVKQAKGEYIVFVDDDDMVTEDYVEEILANANGVDAIGIHGYYTHNGGQYRRFETSIHHQDIDLPHLFLRHINHICPVKRSHALKCQFPDVSFGEDSAYSKKLRESGLLKTENMIDKDIYHYQYRSKK